MSRPTDPLLILVRQVRTRSIAADAGWLFVTSAFIVAIAFIVMALMLTLMPMSIGTLMAAGIIGGAIAVAVIVGVARRWPSEARIARRIDEAMELRELIATGLASTGTDAASQMVRASAVEKARGIRAADVPLRVPSTNTFIAAALMLVAALTINALIHPAPEEVTAATPTRPNRTAAGLMDHDAKPVERADTEAPRATTEAETRQPVMLSEPPATTRAAMTGNASDGHASDNAGRDRGTSASAHREGDLTFNVSSATRDDVLRDESPGATGGAESNPGASQSNTDPMRAGAPSPRIPDQGREVSQRSTSDDSFPSRAVVHIPDRHRDLVRAYFDAAATQPSDTKR